MIFNISGGGGTALNFKILAYATESELLATTPTENTVGVITNTPITSWIFSTTEPSPATPGMVWITTSTSSTVEFNALKKNGIQVYPISAKQYIGGTWVNKAAKSFQGGAWVDWWDGTLYDTGNEYAFVTGGWKAVNAAGATATLKSDGISFTYSGNSDRMAAIYTNNKVAINGRTLYVNVNVSTNNQSFIVGLSTQNTNYVIDGAVAQKQTSGTGDMTLEVPLSGVPQGEYYVFAIAYATAAVVKKIQLK